ncbi:MAG: DUF72 domain-containing protein [Bryobacteraceae bacterium]
MAGPLFQEPGAFDREALAARLRALAAENIFIGGSSWTYEGWLGQVYARERYRTRGRFSRRLFEAECLREYAETFLTACGDFSFYQFPTGDFWRNLFARTPAGFRFAFKAPEQITCKVFPTHPRYGPQGGQENDLFLDSRAFTEMFLRPLLPHRAKTSLIIFEFGPVGQASRPAALNEFLSRLDPFLSSLPLDFRYAVEIRNPEFLAPDYFACLRAHRAAHVYNAWSRMPELRHQTAIPDSATADFLVCRALLRRGRTYENAVAAFAPYTEIKDPNPEARDSMRILIGRAREEKKTLFLFVNNRLEGNAPLTILSLVEP